MKVFFFPDERGGGVTTNLASTCDCDWAASDIDSDSDFCILDHEAGSGIIVIISFCIIIVLRFL